ncbi:DNA mismatch repair protein MutS [Halocatena pleomorpha]|uniref:DNA mismatch repair protein MutS n=1 Tax=Halocatena pleomorpha TaxID=1785090 RepID=A0A3P3RAQ7_9EURY|nr:DNA mismatch repair protein MutS [Halocatena pleomorpha]RRJ30465.1 DNA mismatch repair protein MutS [Halocatena pleomorpha]
MTAEGIVGEYLTLKRDSEADLLAMQMGDFYEFFHDDAETVGQELDLKVSERSSGGETYQMAGVPVDDLTPYVRALVERGYRVAVADQHETENGHARSITRVVTPGTLLETTTEDAQYLAAVVEGADQTDDAEYGLAFVDITTGQFHVTTVTGEDAVLTELYRFTPTEVLPGPDTRGNDRLLERLAERVETNTTLHTTEAFAPGRARHTVREQFGAVEDSVGLEHETAIRAAGAVLSYIEETGISVLAAVTRLQRYRPDDHVELDATTQRNLELVETMTGGGQSLFETIDHTVTSAGGRLLKEWLTRPRRSRGELERRQAGVQALCESAMVREELRELLGDASDLERAASRSVSGSADAHTLLRVRETLALLPEVVDRIERSDRLAGSPLSEIVDRLDHTAVAELRAALSDALAEDPPQTLTQGGLIRQGYDDELDALIEEYESAVEWIDTLAERESGRHDIGRLSVDRNKTDGYYIQVPKSETDAVPNEYEGIKTLKNAQRYVTDELRERERDILRLEERRGELEYELFEELRTRVAEHASLLQNVGRSLAEFDVVASLARHAVRHDWTCPTLTDPGPIDIQAGRHPVVETETEFVPNDLTMTEDWRFLVVTGPNMSGKSTYMRQTALIVLLAQIGSFIPAREATIGLVDGIYTRVGAIDELAQGRSTFMIEMQELSNILHSATEESLVILDEVGRGTATYDGISIAWATTEYLHNQINAKTLFATHYHELTDLADRLPGVHNVHMAAEDRGGDVTFLWTIEDGPADRSYGIHVAELASVPSPVVDRSQTVLERLREDKAIDVRGAKNGTGDTQQVVFDLGSGQFKRASADGGDEVDDERGAVLEELNDIDVNEQSPVELMATVQRWQERLED